MGNIKEEAKRIENQGKELGEKVDRVAHNLENNTGVPAGVWIGIGAIVVLVVLGWIFGS